MVDDGTTELGGSLPVNASGGVLSTNPIGASGMLRFLEVAMQVRGQAGEHQVDGAKLALGDQLAVGGVVDAVGTVHAFGNHRREGRAHEGQVHFITDLDQAVLDDSQRNGVEVGHGSND